MVLLVSTIRDLQGQGRVRSARRNPVQDSPFELLISRAGNTDYGRHPHYRLRAPPIVELAEGVDPGNEVDRALAPLPLDPLEGVGGVGRVRCALSLRRSW